MQTLRDKLREDRRRKRWRFFRFLLILAVLVYGIIYGWQYIHQPGFAFGKIEIHGTSLINEEDLIKMSNSQPPLNLFNVRADLVETALNHDVRFTDVKTEYKWPDILSVTVKERVPAVYVANAYSSYLKVDFEGMVLGVSNDIPDAKAPLLVGEQCGNVYIGDIIANQEVFAVLNFLNTIGQEANEQIVEIVVDEKKIVRMQMKAGYPIIFGNVNNLAEKAEVFMIVFKEVKDKNIQINYIDLTFNKPYVGFKSNNEVKNEISAKS